MFMLTLEDAAVQSSEFSPFIAVQVMISYKWDKDPKKNQMYAERVKMYFINKGLKVWRDVNYMKQHLFGYD